MPFFASLGASCVRLMAWDTGRYMWLLKASFSHWFEVTSIVVTIWRFLLIGRSKVERHWVSFGWISPWWWLEDLGFASAHWPTFALYQLTPLFAGGWVTFLGRVSLVCNTKLPISFFPKRSGFISSCLPKLYSVLVLLFLCLGCVWVILFSWRYWLLPHLIAGYFCGILRE